LASALGNSNHQASNLLASALRENNRLSTTYMDQVKLFGCPTVFVSSYRTFLIEDFFSLPPVPTTPVVHLEL
jgi:hypothetical protein